MSKVIEDEVLDPAKPIAAYNPIKAGIAALAEKYGKTVFSVATTKDMDATKAARAEVRDVRYNVESVRKQLKAPALAYSKRIDAEAAEYTAALLAIETPIDDLIKSEEKRKAEEKAERDRIEAERRQAVQKALDAITSTALLAVGRTSAQIQALIDNLNAHHVTLDDYDDRAGEAESAKHSTLKKLGEMQAAAAAHEAEQARMEAERVEMARLKAEQEAQAAEAARIENERLAAERAEIAAQQAKVRQEQEAAAAQLRADREAMEASQAAERQRQADAQAELDRQRAEIEAQRAAAEKAEQDRIAAEEEAKREKADAEARAAAQKLEDERLARVAAEKAEADKVAKRARTKFIQNGPGQEEIVQVLASHYEVDAAAVLRWLSMVDVTAAA